MGVAFCGRTSGAQAMNQIYLDTARLMTQVAPFVFANDVFALKGGTAINLFLRDMPRLSVDLDLVFRDHTVSRAAALKQISGALHEAGQRLQTVGFQVYALSATDGSETKIIIRRGATEVKVEVNFVMRGTLHPVHNVPLSSAARNALMADLELPIASLEDVYGGKLVAALDRQHPRDLFDVMLMLREEGLTRQIFEGFLVYLISHGRPMADLLEPRWKPLAQIFTAEFAGMTRDPVDLAQLEATQQALLRAIRRQFTERDAEFLLSLKQGAPNWSLFGLPGTEQLPAVRWKLSNIQSMSEEKRREAVARLEAVVERLLYGRA